MFERCFVVSLSDFAAAFSPWAYSGTKEAIEEMDPCPILFDDGYDYIVVKDHKEFLDRFNKMLLSRIYDEQVRDFLEGK